MLQKLLCLLTANIRNSSSQGQAKSSSTDSPNPPRRVNCKILKILKTLATAASGSWLSEHQGCTSFLQPCPAAAAFSVASPQPVQHCIPHQLPALQHWTHPGTMLWPHRDHAKMMQPVPRSSSFPQCLFIACPVFCACRSCSWQQGFLGKAAPAPVEVFYSACFCLTLNCLFESKLSIFLYWFLDFYSILNIYFYIYING